MAVGFRAISLTIWEKVNIKGEGEKWHLSKEGSRGKEKVGDARFMHGTCNNIICMRNHTMHMMT